MNREMVLGFVFGILFVMVICGTVGIVLLYRQVRRFK